MQIIKARKGTTYNLHAHFLDGSGAPVTGLTVAARVQRESDGYFMDDAFAFTSGVPGSEPEMTEVDASNMPGVYVFAFTLPATDESYLIKIDGSSSAGSGTRYQNFKIMATPDADGDAHLAKAFCVNKKVQEVTGSNIGRVTVYDNDGTTPLVELTPGQDDDNATELIITPS